MEKPIVFFSHSSKDGVFLNNLKGLIERKTGKAIEIFLSSDGQSIPLGTNWVHKLHQALEDTTLTFVFLSPGSVNSKWIQFESGYLYSRKIRVIPVGIKGLDLSKVPPPLSLLQGFNLNTLESYDNLIASINEQYKTEFQTNFTKDEMSEFIGKQEYKEEGSAKNIVDNINISVYINNDAERKEFYNKIEALDIVFTSDKYGKLYAPGAEVDFIVDYTPVSSSDIEEQAWFDIRLDYLGIEDNITWVKTLLGPHNFEAVFTKIELNDYYSCKIDMPYFKLTARIKDTGILPGDNLFLLFQGVEFKLYENYIFVRGYKNIEWINELVTNLHEKQIINSSFPF